MDLFVPGLLLAFALSWGIGSITLARIGPWKGERRVPAFVGLLLVCLWSLGSAGFALSVLIEEGRSYSHYKLVVLCIVSTLVGCLSAGVGAFQVSRQMRGSHSHRSGCDHG